MGRAERSSGRVSAADRRSGDGPRACALRLPRRASSNDGHPGPRVRARSGVTVRAVSGWAGLGMVGTAVEVSGRWSPERSHGPMAASGDTRSRVADGPDLRTGQPPRRRILVVGAGGYVGGRLVPLLASHGHDVAMMGRGGRTFPADDQRGRPQLRGGRGRVCRSSHETLHATATVEPAVTRSAMIRHATISIARAPGEPIQRSRSPERRAWRSWREVFPDRP